MLARGALNQMLGLITATPAGSIVLFLVYVSSSCVGLYLIKAADQWMSPKFFLGFLLYAAAAALWMVILRLMPLSFAFPIAAGSLIIGSLLTGYFFLGEAITYGRVFGAALIVAGIAITAIKN